VLTLESARPWYPASDPVHGFDHIERVYFMAQRLAVEEGSDLEIVSAAALLHDAEGSHPTDETARHSHQHASADFARQILRAEGWQEERIEAVLHCIRAHRFRDEREQPQTPEAQVLFDADKLDAIGAIGAARAIAFSLQAGQPVYSQPSKHFLQTGRLEPGEAHTAYHEFLFKLSKLKERLYTPAARRIAEGRHQAMLQFFEELAAEMNGAN
jgi:uncharacterized protein